MVRQVPCIMLLLPRMLQILIKLRRLLPQITRIYLPLIRQISLILHILRLLLIVKSGRRRRRPARLPIFFLRRVWVMLIFLQEFGLRGCADFVVFVLGRAGVLVLDAGAILFM